jgi:hypothetical protein
LKEQNLKKIELTNSWEYENKQISNFVLHRIMKGWKLQMLRIQNITDLLMTQPDKYKAEIMLKMHKRTIIYTHSKTTKLSLVSTQSTSLVLRLWIRCFFSTYATAPAPESSGKWTSTESMLYR